MILETCLQWLIFWTKWKRDPTSVVVTSDIMGALFLAPPAVARLFHFPQEIIQEDEAIDQYFKKALDEKGNPLLWVQRMCHICACLPCAILPSLTF